MCGFFRSTKFLAESASGPGGPWAFRSSLHVRKGRAFSVLALYGRSFVTVLNAIPDAPFSAGFFCLRLLLALYKITE